MQRTRPLNMVPAYEGMDMLMPSWFQYSARYSRTLRHRRGQVRSRSGFIYLKS